MISSFCDNNFLKQQLIIKSNKIDDVMKKMQKKMEGRLLQINNKEMQSNSILRARKEEVIYVKKNRRKIKRFFIW